MLNNRFTRSVSIVLVLVLTLTYVLSSKEVAAASVSAGRAAYYAGMQTDLMTFEKSLLDFEGDLTVSGSLSGDAGFESPLKPNTPIGSLAVELSLNYNLLKQSYENKDFVQFKKNTNDTIRLIEDYNRLILEELDENEKTLKKLNNKKATKKNEEFRAQVTSKISEFKKSLEELKQISEGIDDFDEPETARIEAILKEVESSFFGEQPENPIGNELPHRNVSNEPKVVSTGGEAAAFYISGIEEGDYEELPIEPQSEDLAETDETRLNLEIKELAESLDSVVDMYEYVRNNIDFEPYYGSRKGASGALAQKSGNDYDQASLLIAMLRYKNIPARYVRGLAEIDIDKAMEWAQAETPEAAAKILAAAGIPVTTIVSGGKIIAVCMEHVWVEAYVPYGRYRGTQNEGEKIWVPLDPSFKEYERVEGITTIEDVIEVDRDSISDAVEIVDEETEKVSSVDIELYEDLIDDAVERLQEYIVNNNLEDRTYLEVFGGSRIATREIELLPLSLPYKTRGDKQRFSKVSEEYSDMVSFRVYGQDAFGLNFTGPRDFNVKYKAVDLFNKKVTLSYEPATQGDANIIKEYGDIFSAPPYLVEMVPVLKIDGETVAKGKPIGLGYRQQFEIGMKSAGQSEELVKNDVIAGSFYNVGFNYQKISAYELDSISSKLGGIEYTEDKIYSDEQLGEILNFIAKAYFAELGFMDELLAENMNVSSVRQLSQCITGVRANVNYLFMAPVELTGGGLYIDVDRNVYSVVSRNGNKDASRNYMILSGIMGSALEHSIWEQATGVEAVSTIKVMEIAQEQDIPIYTLSKVDFAEKRDKLNLSDSVMEEISNAINSGKIVIAASEEIQLGDWNGAGYIVMDPHTGAAGYMISGGIAGGASSIVVNTAFLLNLGLVVWDLVEIAQMFIIAISLAPVNFVIALAIGCVAVVLLSFILMSLIEILDLYIDYVEGDGEAGDKLINNAIFNAGITLGVVGLGKFVKFLAQKVVVSKLIGALGEETAEKLLKEMTPFELSKSFRKLNRAGVPYDIIREYGEKWGKNGLEWLSAKSALNFTGSELRKLARLGDNLYNYTDEFLTAFKYSGCQDEIIEGILKYGDDIADVLTKHGDDAVRAISRYGDDAVELIAKHGDEAVRAISKYGEEGLTAIYYYGDQLVDLVRIHGDDVVEHAIKYGDDAVELIAKHGDEAVRAISKYGEEGLTAIYYYGDQLVDLARIHGDDVVEHAIKYGDDAVEVITKYGDDALEAISKNIDPDLIKQLDDLGIKPSDYDNFRITGRESAEKVAKAVENAKYTRAIMQEMPGFMDDMASVLDNVGMSIDRFNELMALPADLLSDADRAAMKAIRDAIPMSTEETIMQKVIPQGDIANYISGSIRELEVILLKHRM